MFKFDYKKGISYTILFFLSSLSFSHLMLQCVIQPLRFISGFLAGYVMHCEAFIQPTPARGNSSERRGIRENGEHVV
ncbi:hypothetical protein VTN00DRAFT_4119 [Thermoascus crustaceus]|uniref:uncharacterized protein n=1 Tax=Thermoascus crustaceus TaxID=5088 RepID=UPI0037430F7D